MLRALVLALASGAARRCRRVRLQPQTQEEIFLAARAAVRTGDYDKLARYDAQLQDYVLEPYVESWLLRPRLEDATADEVRAFLARQQGTVLAEQVRKEWLKVLGKTRQWDLFRAEHPLLVNDDNETACYALQARWEQKDESALAEVRAQWYAPRELPEGCVPLAEALIARGEFTDRQVWERVRLLLEAGAVSAAWRTAEYLPASEMPDRGKLFRGSCRSETLPRRKEEGPVAPSGARTRHVRRVSPGAQRPGRGRRLLGQAAAGEIFRRGTGLRLGPAGAAGGAAQSAARR